MARYYFQNYQINDDDWYLVDADTQLIARSRRPEPVMAGPGTEWLTGLRVKNHRSTMWKEVPEGTLGASKKWSPQPALIDLDGRNCRGGFSVGELDEFMPGWRERDELIVAVSDIPAFMVKS